MFEESNNNDQCNILSGHNRTHVNMSNVNDVNCVLVYQTKAFILKRFILRISMRVGKRDYELHYCSHADSRIGTYPFLSMGPRKKEFFFSQFSTFL